MLYELYPEPAEESGSHPSYNVEEEEVSVAIEKSEHERTFQQIVHPNVQRSEPTEA